MGELGIGLPLLASMDYGDYGFNGFYGPIVTACYWHLNWGRILLQNVTIIAVDKYGAQDLGASLIVPETGTATWAYYYISRGTQRGAVPHVLLID
jgi:hypothetical protein